MNQPPAMIDMKGTLLFLTMLLTATVTAQQPMSPETPEVLWTWSKQCGGNHKLGVAIRLEHKVLYRSVLPICRGSRDAEEERAEFHFAGGHLSR